MPKNIKVITILGAGTMGPSLALAYAKHNYKVQIWSKDKELLPSAKVSIEKSMATIASFENISKEKMVEIISNITFYEDLNESLKNTDYVIEAIVENMDAKREIYHTLDSILQEDIIISSNTSVLNIFDLMPKRRLANAIISHWFAPPHIIPLVEVIKDKNTSQNTIDITMNLLKKINKVPILLNKYIPGFIINRLQMILNKEVYYLLDENIISPQDLDLAVKMSLAPRMMVLGLLQRIDFGGLDITAKNIENNQYQLPPENPRPRILFDKVQKGDLGIKTGKGFFDYTYKDKESILKERDKRLLKTLECSKGWDMLGR